MSGKAAGPSSEGHGWTGLVRRLSPFLDVALGIVAAVLSVVSLVSTDVAEVDPRLQPWNVLSVVATLVARSTAVLN